MRCVLLDQHKKKGLLPGEAWHYLICSEHLNSVLPTFSGAESQAIEILMEAYQAPFRQILENAGKDPNEVINSIIYKDSNTGYNLKTGEYGDMFKMGVVDPLKVTKNALKNAVSVATTILSTNAIVTMARSYETE